jgi:putative exosortase-associated protein (TIGR04073 family)
MKKVLALAVVMVVACAPLSFAACPVCNATGSDNYGVAAAGKLGRGILNAGFGWVELFRQPIIRENKWEGVGRGLVHTVTRTLSGGLEAATFIIPGASIPVPDPACPLDMAKK